MGIIIGSTARRLTPATRPAAGGIAGNARRKVGVARGRPRAPRSAMAGAARHPAYAGPFPEAGREELDPAFDEFGALSDHVDGLGGHLRGVSTCAGRDEPWDIG